MHEILKVIEHRLKNELGLDVSSSKPLDGKSETKLLVSKGDVQIKIEPNYILRGSLFPTKKIKLCEKASLEFELDLSVNCLSFEDVYGGKICAALDRQHPRDLFDIKYLFENEGITEDVKDSFVFYLVSHNRPIHELLNPNFKDINLTYTSEFENMAEINIDLTELVKVRDKLVRRVMGSLRDKDKEFLISFVSNSPDWSKVRDSKIKDYPSVKWKMMNQKKMSGEKLEKYIELVTKNLS